MRILSLAFLLVIGCVPVRSRSEAECAPPADGNARAIPLHTLVGLAGRYRMTSETTAPGYDRAPIVRDLTLTIADSLQRYYEQGVRGPRRAGNRPLVGSLGQEPVVVQQNPGNTQMISGFCTMCIEAMFITTLECRFARMVSSTAGTIRKLELAAQSTALYIFIGGFDRC